MPVVRTIYAEADGKALPDPDPAEPGAERVLLDDHPQIHAGPARDVSLQGFEVAGIAAEKPSQIAEREASHVESTLHHDRRLSGAGKTTTIARLARHYQAHGRSVGIVTNDQATDLVDTHSLRSQGFDVGEVPGACFCCNFDELTEHGRASWREAAPDVILAEPVGSCTDLVATVVRPLMQICTATGSTWRPTACCSSRATGCGFCADEPNAGLFAQGGVHLQQAARRGRRHPHQPHRRAACRAEIDELDAAGRQAVSRRAGAARFGQDRQGFDALLDSARPGGAFGRDMMDIDYDIYAEGEAELGWLNSSLVVRGQGRLSSMSCCWTS